MNYLVARSLVQHGENSFIGFCLLLLNASIVPRLGERHRSVQRGSAMGFFGLLRSLNYRPELGNLDFKRMCNEVFFLKKTTPIFRPKGWLESWQMWP